MLDLLGVGVVVIGLAIAVAWVLNDDGPRAGAIAKALLAPSIIIAVIVVIVGLLIIGLPVVLLGAGFLGGP